MNTTKGTARVTRECERCKTEYKTNYLQQRFCTRKCNQAFWKERHLLPVSHPALPTGTVGTIGELKAAAYFLERGYEVFRSISANSSCDLAVLKNSQLVRVEVRMGHVTDRGRIYTVRTHRADVLAIITPAGVILEGNTDLL